MPAKLLVLPGLPTARPRADQIKNAIGELHDVFFLPLPNLAKTTLNKLLAIVDSLEKSDMAFRSLSHRMEKHLYDVYQRRGSKLLPINLGQTMLRELQQSVISNNPHIQHFPTTEFCQSALEALHREFTQIDSTFRDSQSELQSQQASCTTLKRQLEGNLLFRSLYDYMEPDDVVESEFLTTKMVVVSLSQEEEFLATYSTGLEWIVPDSAKEVTRDKSSVVFRVVLFKKIEKEFGIHFQRLGHRVRNTEKSSIRDTHDKLVEECESLQKEFDEYCSTTYPYLLRLWMNLMLLRGWVEGQCRFEQTEDSVPLCVIYIMNESKYDGKVVKALEEYLSNEFATEHMESVFDNVVYFSFDMYGGE
ncbi:hypothetical protein PCE1_003426 [Barthelona sp. PCE]